MDELYALAYFDKNTGDFVEYVRKGRNYSITGYDNLAAAKRGYAHSKRSHMADTYDLRIVVADRVVIVKEIEY